jgi:hypothetical protein
MSGPIISGGGGPGSSPLTTKGDVFGYNSNDARIPIGGDGTFLEADSAQALGLKWGTPSGSGDALVANPLSQFAATTSLQLLGVMSDATGTGLAVFATSPTLITPLLGTPTSGVLTNCTGTAAGLTSGNVTTNANLTGDVTSIGNAATIASNAVDLTMMADMATASIIGRDTAASGDPEILSATTVRTILNVESGSTADQSDAEIKTAYENNADTNAFTNAEQTIVGNQSGTNTGDEAVADLTTQGVVELATVVETDTGTDATRAVTPAGLATIQTDVDANTAKVSNATHTGNVTGDVALTIANDAVTLVMMADMATDSFIGRDTATTGDPEILSATIARTILNVENGSTADQSDAEIKTAYENNADTNAFTDAEQTIVSTQSGTNTGDEAVADLTTQGIVELATVSETDTGTDATRAVTPAGLANIQSAVTANTAKVSNVNHTGEVTGSTTLTIAAVVVDVDNIVAASNILIGSVAFIIDGGGSVITTGIKGDLVVDFDCTIDSVTMLADVSGSIVVDIWKDTYANYPPVVGDTITAAAKPTITTAVKSQDLTLDGWNQDIIAGDVLRFNVDSVTTITRVLVSLKVTKVI